jgi:hypothetical protein
MWMWWWTYVYHIKGCDAHERNEVGLQLESLSPMPLSFKWADPIPIVSDDFERWRDSIINTLSSNQILHITGLAYRDEVPGTERVVALGTKRSQAISHLFALRLPPSRIEEDADVGELTGDIKNRNFPAYRLHKFIRNDFILEMNDCTWIHIPDPNTPADNEFVTDYIAQLHNHLSESGKSITLHTLVEPGEAQDSSMQHALKCRSLLRDMMITAGIPVEKVLMPVDRDSPSPACMQKEADIEFSSWIAVTTTK